MKDKEKVKEFFVTVCIAITLIIMCCCCFRQHVNDFGIVTSVEVKSSEFVYGKNKKYRVTVGQEFNTRFKASCYIYTDTLYQVGDTIKIR